MNIHACLRYHMMWNDETYNPMTLLCEYLMANYLKNGKNRFSNRKTDFGFTD